MGDVESGRLSDTDLSLLLFRLRGCGEVVCEASDILRLAEELRDWLAREQALEEAARIVEDHYWDDASPKHGEFLAKTIRALKTRKTSPADRLVDEVRRWGT